ARRAKNVSRGRGGPSSRPQADAEGSHAGTVGGAAGLIALPRPSVRRGDETNDADRTSAPWSGTRLTGDLWRRLSFPRVTPPPAGPLPDCTDLLYRTHGRSDPPAELPRQPDRPGAWRRQSPRCGAGAPQPSSNDQGLGPPRSWSFPIMVLAKL